MEILSVVVDKKEAEAIERRRHREALRQERIFNVRERTMGLDTDALNRQSAERSRREQVEEERQEAYAREMIRNDKLSALASLRHEQDRRELAKDLNNFRSQNQRADTRREWDLNDPASKLKDKPGRISDFDRSLGLSAAQVFDGEDLASKTRREIQQTQRNKWAESQKAEKEYKNQVEEFQKHKYAQQQLENIASFQKMEDEILAQKAAERQAIKDFNIQQANERKQREAENAQAELQDKLTEIKNNIFGDTLTENPKVAMSAFGSHRVITDRWKGMSPAQIQNIREIREKQLEEKQTEQNIRKTMDKQWDDERIRQAKTLTLMERSEARQRREQQKSLIEENRRLAKEQAAKINYIDHEVYTNPPTRAYFNQFNTTSR
ncbi:unnamed protein product [Oikopleura dioica]|uniref:RIB43A-like with coiled-coils protein 2 n=2 Tax=Oikopleura dioica TaxID=34765 RepID=E4X6A6_OIKDI|nr:unnamed protein product [Oikopleura dioica]